MEDDDVIEGQPNFQNPASRGSGELGVGHVWNSSLGHDDGSYRSKGLMEDLGHGRNGGSNLVAFLEVVDRASFLNLITCDRCLAHERSLQSKDSSDISSKKREGLMEASCEADLEESPTVPPPERRRSRKSSQQTKRSSPSKVVAGR